MMLFTKVEPKQRAYIVKNIKLAWPIALNALLMQGMLMIDTLLISPLGSGALAAMGIASTIVALMLGIQNALANGSQNVLSRAIGSGRNDIITKSFISAIIINISFAILFFVLLSFFKWPLIKLLSSDVRLYSDINAYLSVIQYSLLLTGFSQVTIALFNAMGRTKLPLMSYLFTMPINAIVSYYLVHGIGSFAGMGIGGAALGSIIALGLRMLFLLFFLKYSRNIKLSFLIATSGLIRNVQLHFKEIFPIAVNMMVLSIGLATYNFLYAQLPTATYAALVMVMPWLSALGQFVVAWAVSSAITISQAIGSNNLDTLDSDVDLSIRVTIVVSGIIAFASFLLSLGIEKIYPGHAPITYRALTSIAPLYILMPLIQGYITVHGQVLRALGKTTAVFKINFITRWLIALPMCAFAVLVLDASIVWVYAITVFEQVLKIYPMRSQARRFLREFDSSKADQLMYD